ncbi:MAG: hypothetical protein APR63_06720 [Desulfuromonas sp. SDB]|nr:MAG: hypothetical protein APR63_06720 [Desulfuromonas sp. SDB]
MSNLNKIVKIGGQAIIEGVMMITPGSWALAVRKPNGDIETRSWQRTSLIIRYPILKLPFIRGFITLIEMMTLGFKSLDLSAQLAYEEESGKSWKDNLIMIVSLLAVVALFFLLPFWASKKLIPGIYANNQGLLNIIIGLVRLLLFVLYLCLISLSKEIRRIFEYHGAEHQAIHCYESGYELNPENAGKLDKEHPRCGTSLILVTLIFAILISSLVDTLLFNILGVQNNPVIRTLVHLALIPLVAGSAYEFNKLGYKYQNHPIFKVMIFPGLMFQKITTRKPDQHQLEVSIEAIHAAMDILEPSESQSPED